MLLRLLSILFIAAAVSGCASTQLKTQNAQLESRVSDLEKNVQSKDAEIVDLQYQVKDLSSKVDASKNPEPEAASPELAAPLMPVKSEIDNTQIVRVKVSPERIQRALKAAGVYTGAVDGKIGSGTREAIIEFQKSHGLKADGVLGRRTWEALKAYLK